MVAVVEYEGIFKKPVFLQLIHYFTYFGIHGDDPVKVQSIGIFKRFGLGMNGLNKNRILVCNGAGGFHPLFSKMQLAFVGNSNIKNMKNGCPSFLFRQLA
jgi:hypothetical protein